MLGHSMYMWHGLSSAPQISLMWDSRTCPVLKFHTFQTRKSPLWGQSPSQVLEGPTPPAQPLPPSFPLPGGKHLVLPVPLEICPEHPEHVSRDRHFNITLGQALGASWAP